MPLMPVVVVPHAGGPPGWEAAIARLGDCLAAHDGLTVALRVPGAAVEHLAGTDGWSGIDPERVLFLAGGFTDPILPLLPPPAQRLQMNRELTVMDAAGVSPAGLWVADAWDPGLVTRALRSSLHLLFFPADFLGERVGPPLMPGAIERAGEAVIGIPVMSGSPPSEEGGFVAVRTTAEELENLITAHGDRLEPVTSYLDRIGPGPRLTPRLHSPQLHPERHMSYRKLLLLVRDQGERTSGQDAILDLQSRHHLLTAETNVDADLLSARIGLERSRRRGDAAHTTVLDWDADGVDEIRIESPHVSLVVDPARAAVAYWDDKTSVWPVTAVQPTSSMLLVSRQDAAGAEIAAEPLRVTARSEGRAHAMVDMTGDDGTSCRLEVNGRLLSLELAVNDADPVLVGPEIPLHLTDARLRVDGGAWTDVTEAMAVAGHRFRLTDDRHSLVISSLRPCELFIQPLDRGLMVWPHWLATGGDSYRVSLEPV